MEIVYSKDLAQYLVYKNKPHILIEAASAKSCGGAMNFFTARAVNQDEMSAALPKAKASYDGFIGKVLVMQNGLNFGDKIELDIHSFFGIKDITIENCHVF